MNRSVPEPVFTGLPEADALILLQLPFPSVLRTCQSSLYLQSLCGDPFFWYRMIIRDFGQEVLQYKPPNETYQQQYEYLYRVTHEETNTKLATYLSGEIPFPSSVTGNEIVNGRIDALIALRDIGIPLEYVDENAARFGQLEILKWYESQGLQLSPEDADGAARGGYLDILKWLAERGILPDQESIDMAARYGHVNILEWASHLDPPVLPNANVTEYPATWQHLNSIYWLIRNGIIEWQLFPQDLLPFYQISVKNPLRDQRYVNELTEYLIRMNQPNELAALIHYSGSLINVQRARQLMQKLFPRGNRELEKLLG